MYIEIMELGDDGFQTNSVLIKKDPNLDMEVLKNEFSEIHNIILKDIEDDDYNFWVSIFVEFLVDVKGFEKMKTKEIKL